LPAKKNANKLNVLQVPTVNATYIIVGIYVIAGIQNGPEPLFGTIVHPGMVYFVEENLAGLDKRLALGIEPEPAEFVEIMLCDPIHRELANQFAQ
jgi:hypothetical protein